MGQILPNMREEIRQRYISKIIDSSRSKKEVVLWQNVDEGRTLQTCHLVRVSELTGTLKFYSYESSDFKFDSAKPVYFYDKSKVIIFKSQICFQSNAELEVHMPESVLLKEDRVSERLVFDFERQFVNFTIKSEKYDKLFKKRMLDYSDTGLSFQVTELELDFFKDVKFINVMTTLKTTHPKKALIKYWALEKDKLKAHESLYRVGVEFT